MRAKNIYLEVRLDPRRPRLEGKVTYRLQAIGSDLRQVVFDQTDLQIESVRVRFDAWKSAPFHVDGQRLRVSWDTDSKDPISANREFEVEITYAVERPRRGIYFTGPNPDHPEKPYQTWTQGQDEDSRYWFPSLDYPNQKSTVEVIAEVPEEFHALSNGVLLKTEASAHGFKRYFYRQGQPISNYLITLVVGQFAQIDESGPHGLPVQYFVTPGREEDARRSFGNTPRMIEVFERKTGVKFPYEKYAQVAVQDFIFGGMENASATTQTDLTLHDARAHLDFSSDPLVSHELAHQWFGDLVTCRDWSHAWLNEGFATFMERVWVENDESFGALAAEEAKFYSYLDFKAHQEEDSARYRRPIVCNTYIEPIDLFDTHIYQKGGLVLNLLRHLLGEDGFWASVKVYLERHRQGSVETIDLIRAIEDATGRNMRQFFDEWVFSGGYPEFELSYQWHEDDRLAELVIEQKQTGGRPELSAEGSVTPLFHLPVIVEFWADGRCAGARKIHLGANRERVFFPMDSKPSMIRFDPGFAIPKKLKFARPKEMLLHHLSNDPDCMGRIQAAHDLRDLKEGGEGPTVQALESALLSDAFWGVQAEIAGVLADFRSYTARDALIRVLKAGVKHPKARRAVIQALGRFHDAEASRALKPFADGDPSVHVEAQAIRSWAGTHYGFAVRRAEAELEEVERFLIQKLEVSSYRDVIRRAAIGALAAMPGVGRGLRPASLRAIQEGCARKYSSDARATAIQALGDLARTAEPSIRADILRQLDALADEDDFRVRMAMIDSLTATEAPEAVSSLRKIHRLDSDGRIRRDAWVAADQLIASGATPEALSKLKDELSRLEEDLKRHQGWLEELRGKHKRAEPPAVAGQVTTQG